jgi:hypothetical protein
MADDKGDDAKQKAAAQPRPGVEVGDHMYVHLPDGPCTGRVVAHGRHGLTAEVDGKHHRVTWDKVLGHKQRIPQRYEILDHGEDGMLVQDANGRKRYVNIPPESQEDPMITKAFGPRAILLLKSGSIKNRPGLALEERTDKAGHQAKHWVRTTKDQPAAQGPGATPDDAAAGTRQFSQNNVKAGHGVKFKAGDFEGSGTVIGKPGADGAHVKDDSGRSHQVRWSEMTDHNPNPGAGDGPAAKPPAEPGADPAGGTGEPGADGKTAELFSPEELKGLPVKAKQPVSTWAELQTEGAKALKEFTGKLGEVAKQMGLEMGKKPDDMTDDDWSNDKGYVFIGSLKGEKRAKEKVEGQYGGDWSKLLDIVRATISVPTMGDVGKAVSDLKAQGITLAQQPKDRFSKPTKEGYRDLMMIVKLPTGMVAELQIHVKAMTLAKTAGHHPFETTRTLEGKYDEDEPSDKWSDKDHKDWHEALGSQKKIYGDAWDKIQAQSNGASSKPLQKSLHYPKMIIVRRGK